MRRRAASAFVALLAVAPAVGGACGADGRAGGPGAPSGPSSASPSSSVEPPASAGGAAAAPTPPATEPGAADPASHPVPESPTSAPPGHTTTAAPVPLPSAVRAPAGSTRQVQVTYRDGARGRELLTTVHWPARPSAGTPTLVVIAHGYSLPGWGYDELAKQLAVAGFVVAVPDFPHTSGVVGDGNRSDITNQPADISFVVDAVGSGRNPDGTSAPWPTPDPAARYGIVGHSDGGLTATALAYNAGFHDPRVGACVSLTGGIGLFPGTAFGIPAAAVSPLLAVHGSADETNPASASTGLFVTHPGHPTAPKHLLTVAGGSHLGPYMFDTEDPAMGALVADFLDRALRQPDGSDAVLGPPQSAILSLQSG